MAKQYLFLTLVVVLASMIVMEFVSTTVESAAADLVTSISSSY